MEEREKKYELIFGHLDIWREKRMSTKWKEGIVDIIHSIYLFCYVIKLEIILEDVVQINILFCIK